VGNGQSFAYMFKYSGMNHFIGDWNFKSINRPLRLRSLSVFFSMLGAWTTNCDDLEHDELHDEWEQLNNFVGLVNCAKKWLITL